MKLSSIYLGYWFFLMIVVNSKFHLLMSLLGLEGLMLMLLLILLMKMSLGLMSYMGLIMFSYVMVCEGIMGSSILVQLVRGVGMDNFFFHYIY